MKESLDQQRDVNKSYNSFGLGESSDAGNDRVYIRIRWETKQTL